jgi:hypothetical protein
MLLVYSSYFQEKTNSVHARVCNDNGDGNGPQSSCGSSREFHNGNSRTQTSDQSDDGSNDGSSGTVDKHEDSNHALGDGHHDDNHRNGGHDSKDDIPFSLPFP